MFVLDTETAQAVAAAYHASGGSLEAAVRVLRTAFRGLPEGAARQTAAAILGLPDPAAAPETERPHPPVAAGNRPAPADQP